MAEYSHFCEYEKKSPKSAISDKYCLSAYIFVNINSMIKQDLPN